MFKHLIIPAIAIVSIAATATAEANPTNNRVSQAEVVCDARGCSDNPMAQTNSTRRSSRAQRSVRAPAATATVTTTTVSAVPHRTSRQRARGGRSDTHVVCDARGCSDRAPAGQATAAQSYASLPRYADANGNGTIVGGRPAGCPHRYCGCAASLYVFGEIRPDLNLAANWARKFPRTTPASGMVASRPGHVFVLISHAGGDEWLVYDGNSGGGRTRQHVRSIRGYAIVNPRATMTAQN